MFSFFKKQSAFKNPFGKFEKLNLSSLATPFDDKKSPFSIYDNETHKTQSINERTSSESIDFLIRQGYINEIDLQIISLINTHMFLTSKQIFDLLAVKNPEITRDIITKKLKRLFQKNILYKTSFLTLDKQSAFYAYSIGYHGKQMLKTQDIKPKLLHYLSISKTSDLKALLSLQQFIVSVYVKNPDMSYDVKNMLVCDGVASAIVRYHAKLSCQNSTYFVECVRNSEDWQENLLNRLSRYELIVKNRKKANIQLGSDIYIILVAEDVEHIKKIYETVSAKKYKGIHFMITCDIHTNSLFFKEPTVYSF